MPDLIAMRAAPRLSGGLLRRLVPRTVFAVAALFAVSVSIASGTAPAQAAYRLSAQDLADVGRVEAYLNTIESVRSAFVQLASGGRFAEGKLYIERPKRLRLDYNKPATTQVYANGNWLIHVDTELETVTHVPLSYTVAGFLVRERIELGGDILVRRVVRAEGAVSIEMSRRDEPDQGSFTVTFRDNPLQLHKWSVVDAQGVTTNVTLIAPEFNVMISRDLFIFDETKYEREFQ